jgi:hypothetical protein
MSKFKIKEVIEQKATFDGVWKLPIDSYLLMKIINHMAAEDKDEIADMKNPQQFIVRVVIETKKI